MDPTILQRWILGRMTTPALLDVKKFEDLAPLRRTRLEYVTQGGDTYANVFLLPGAVTGVYIGMTLDFKERYQAHRRGARKGSGSRQYDMARNQPINR